MGHELADLFKLDTNALEGPARRRISRLSSAQAIDALHGIEGRPSAACQIQLTSGLGYVPASWTR